MTAIKIRTNRLILREILPEDWQFIHSYSSDPETVRHMPFGPNTVVDTKAYIRKSIRQRQRKNRTDYTLAITLKKNNLLIGACRISIKSPKQRRGSIGYILNRRHWNNGYMTEAVKALLDYGFRTLNLHRIIATCRPKNMASKRVMEKNGMRREAHFKKHIFYKGRWHDSLLFAILEDGKKP